MASELQGGIQSLPQGFNPARRKRGKQFSLGLKLLGVRHRGCWQVCSLIQGGSVSAGKENKATLKEEAGVKHAQRVVTRYLVQIFL